jgi:hypothetical protein
VAKTERVAIMPTKARAGLNGAESIGDRVTGGLMPHAWNFATWWR